MSNIAVISQHNHIQLREAELNLVISVPRSADLINIHKVSGTETPMCQDHRYCALIE